MRARYQWRPHMPGSMILLLMSALGLRTAIAQPLASPYKTTRLDNGLQVIVIENHTVPLVTVDITVRNGSFTESDEFAGLSHLYEHMFFKANAAIPSQELFMDRIGKLGIVFNGYTSDEVVTYFFTLPAKQAPDGMKFMADAIRTPMFKDEELVKEREVVLGEFDRNEAQPNFVLNYAMDSAMWMPYVSRKQPLGQRPVIQTATVEKMRMIQNRYYVPNNSALIVSGDVDAEEIFGLARKYYGTWQPGAEPFPSNMPPAFPELKPRLIVREAKVPDVVIHYAFRGPSVGKDEPAPYQASLLTTLINQPTSRFYQHLVDSGLVTRLGGGYDAAHNTGTFDIYANAPKEKARKASEVIKQELAAMGRPGYFSDEEIGVAKQIVADDKLFDQDNVYRFTIGTTARWWSMASLDYYLGFPENVAKVTPEGLRDFVNRYIVGRPFILGIGSDRATLDNLNFTEEALKW